MRASRTTLLWAMGMAAIGCGSGTGANSGGGGGAGTTQNGGYQTPPSTYDKPPTGTYDKPPSDPQPGSDFDQPPSIYDTPPGQGATSGGSISSLCDSICQPDLLQCLVDAGNSQTDPAAPPVDVTADQCKQECSQSIGGVPCASELVGVWNCVFSKIDLTCDLFKALDDGDASGLDQSSLQACESVAQAYVSCAGSTDGTGSGNGNGNDNGKCTMASGCTDCADDCADCLCTVGPAQAKVCDPVCKG